MVLEHWMAQDCGMRRRLLTSPFLLLFALMNIAIGADVKSVALMLVSGAGALGSGGRLIRSRVLQRQADAWPREARSKWSAWSCGSRNLIAAGLVMIAAYAEWVVLHVATDPWIDAPPGPVHGEISAHGPDFGKGVTWNPDLCRPAVNPGVTAVALMEKVDPFPLAWVIARHGGGIAAVDVQRSAAASTIRFYPADCTRLHGDVQPVGNRAATGLIGYVDAECTHGDASITMHVDFSACATAPAVPAPVPAPASDRTPSAP